MSKLCDPNLIGIFSNMSKKISIMVCLSCIVCACAAPKPPAGYNVDQSESSLAEASYAVSRSMVDLAETAQAAHPYPNLTPPPSPASYGMDGITSVDWSGPVEPLVRQIAKSANYRVRVLGTPPAIPVMVTVFTKNAMLGDILRDVGYQTGRRAAVVVFPESRVIELRYAKN
jgi:defect-in-organelle-trafficking protein DotD